MKKKKLLKIVNELAGFKITSTSTVAKYGSNNGGYDLKPMLNKKKDILKVIDDVKNKGYFLCPF